MGALWSAAMWRHSIASSISNLRRRTDASDAKVCRARRCALNHGRLDVSAFNRRIKISIAGLDNFRESHARGLCWKLVASGFCVGTPDSPERVEHNLMIRLLPGIRCQLAGE